MRRKGGARRAALLAPDFRTLVGIDALRLAPKQRDFLFREQLGQEQPALFVEMRDCCGVRSMMSSPALERRSLLCLPENSASVGALSSSAA